MICPQCGPSGLCTYECRDDLPREARQQAAAMAVIFEQALLSRDFVGRKVDDALIAEMSKVLLARMEIMDELVEHEEAPAL